MKVTFLILFTFVSSTTSGQEFTESKIDIDRKVNAINSNKALKIIEYGEDEPLNLKILLNTGVIEKVVNRVDLEKGFIETILYLSEQEVIKIVDSEYNYMVDKDGSVLHETNPEEVYRADIYVFDWESDSTEIYRIGSRNMSEGSCGIYEFESLIQLAKKLTER